MKWVKERDLLIAQTLAFVQSVTGKKPETDAPDVSFSSEVKFESLPVLESASLESPVLKSPVADLAVEAAAIATPITLRPPYVGRGAVREEIEGRVAAFRAHQQRFDRERDRHFTSVLTGIRAAIKDPSRPPRP